MKIQILTILFLIFSMSLIAQKQKTKYFDKYWFDVKDKNSASYYRITQKSKDSLNDKIYYVTDYYISDTVQMNGTFKSLNPEIKHGTFTWYYPSGMKKYECKYVDNKKQGEYKYYYESGKIRSIASYINDTVSGKFMAWHENDTMSTMAYYKNGKLDGKLYTFYPNGNLYRFDIYHQGALVQGKCYTIEGRDTTYFPFMIQPTFPGGVEKFHEYLKKNLNYPPCALYDKLQGKVIVNVTVETDGTLSNPTIAFTDNKCFNRNAIMAVIDSPKWIPGKVDGLMKPMTIGIPIYFILGKNL